MTPVERRYRRTLRLLPAEYRQMWEEDMVNAYMDSASHDAGSARSRAEHLSVLGLALRLRLSGGHASPHGRAWRGAVDRFALIALLYLALGGIVTVTTLVIGSRPSASFDPPTTAAFVQYWSSAVPALLWVAAFVTMVLGHVAAPRLLVLAAFLFQVSVMANGLLSEVRPHVQLDASTPGMSLVWRQAVELSVANGLWLAIVTVATLIAAEAGSPKSGRGRWFWLGGGGLGALVLVAVQVVESDAYPVRPATYVSLGVAMHLGLLAAMVAVLAVRRNPRWLLALALFVMVFAGGELLDYARYILDGMSVGQEFFSPLSYTQRFDIGLLALAIGCAVVGLIGPYDRGADVREPVGDVVLVKTSLHSHMRQVVRDQHAVPVELVQFRRRRVDVGRSQRGQQRRAESHHAGRAPEVIARPLEAGEVGAGWALHERHPAISVAHVRIDAQSHELPPADQPDQRILACRWTCVRSGGCGST